MDRNEGRRLLARLERENAEVTQRNERSFNRLILILLFFMIGLLLQHTLR